MPTKPRVSKNKAKERKAAKKKSSKGSRNAQAKAKSDDGDKSALASRGKTVAGAGRGSGDKQGKGRGKSKSPGNSGVVVLSRPKPAYPRKALRSKKEGWVKVSFTVTEKGTVANPKVMAAKPRRIFDRSALQAIRKWRFKPKKVRGKPVRAKATQVIQFSLAKR